MISRRSLLTSCSKFEISFPVVFMSWAAVSLLSLKDGCSCTNPDSSYNVSLSTFNVMSPLRWSIGWMVVM